MSSVVSSFFINCRVTRGKRRFTIVLPNLELPYFHRSESDDEPRGREAARQRESDEGELALRMNQIIRESTQDQQRFYDTKDLILRGGQLALLYGR